MADTPTNETTYETLVADAVADPRTLVRVEQAGPVVTVTLDDPAKYNVLSTPLTRVAPESAGS
jgi:hypothetical protein